MNALTFIQENHCPLLVVNTFNHLTRFRDKRGNRCLQTICSTGRLYYFLVPTLIQAVSISLALAAGATWQWVLQYCTPQYQVIANVPESFMLLSHFLLDPEITHCRASRWPVTNSTCTASRTAVSFKHTVQHQL